MFFGTDPVSYGPMWELLFMSLAGLCAGTMNAIAGGGSFVTFPAMVLVGLPPIVANASSTVALFPGSLASAWAYRHQLTSFGGVRLRVLVAVSLIGGFIGALLLLLTPARLFDQVVPWLLVLATLSFLFGREAGAALRRRVKIGPVPFVILQFGLAIYGGYFGGAVGLMLMAAWTLLDSAELKAMNPAKVVLVGTMNSIAVATFILAAQVRWPETLAMLAGAVIGGYGGARVSRFIDPRLIRAFVILVSTVMTGYFLRRAF